MAENKEGGGEGVTEEGVGTTRCRASVKRDSIESNKSDYQL